MSKYKSKLYNQSRKEERDYTDGHEERSRGLNDRRKEKRFERALRVKSIEELEDLEDDGIDPDDYENWLELINETYIATETNESKS